jgi:hypothetical protein
VSAHDGGFCALLDEQTRNKALMLAVQRLARIEALTASSDDMNNAIGHATIVLDHIAQMAEPLATIVETARGAYVVKPAALVITAALRGALEALSRAESIPAIAGRIPLFAELERMGLAEEAPRDAVFAKYRITPAGRAALAARTPETP